MNRSIPRRSQRGVTLVELSIAVVVLGLCLLVVWQVGNFQRQSATVFRSMSELERAEAAVQAFLQTRGRLPCPAPDALGVEKCGKDNIGYFPFVTVGVADPALGKILFGVSPDAPSLTTGVPFSIGWVQTGAFGDLNPSKEPLASIAGTGIDPIFNFCGALAGASAAATQLAYELAEDSAAGLAHPMSVRTGRGELASRLRCGTLLVSGRAHYNTVVAARIMARAMSDLLVMYEQFTDLANIDLAQGVWFAFSAAFSDARSVLAVNQAVSAYLASDGKDPRLPLKTAVAVAQPVIVAANAISLGSHIGRYTLGLLDAKAFTNRMKVLQGQVDDSVAAILQHANEGAKPVFSAPPPVKSP